jgi:DNA-binding transcriptional ArsR family regulator
MKFQSQCAGCFAGLSCGQRIEILSLLQQNKKMSVMEIAKHFQISQPTITHHLQYLKTAGILSSKKEGKYVYYFIDPKCDLLNCNLFS